MSCHFLSHFYIMNFQKFLSSVLYLLLVSPSSTRTAHCALFFLFLLILYAIGTGERVTSELNIHLQYDY